MTPAPTEQIAPAHSNRLANEKSPYLLQHANNPVAWYPWGDEAFAKARSENKPIFLSIGYSTCHWCHVMAHESFENPDVAAVMNREFVNIKVDREERPDVDRVYMTFVQATTGGGGWPMSVWLTPDLKPFVGGTYFPPEDRYGQPGFTKVLERIAAAWKHDHEKIAEQGAKIIVALSEAEHSGASDNTPKLEAEALDEAYKQIARSYDAHEGGFGSAPKFPRPVTLNFLFRMFARNKVSESGKHALEMSLFTLRKMAAGGMHDHLGGGFHRYSVDTDWHVPHFEKMLYDQAQLVVAYVDAFQITRDATFERIARDTLDYVARDMTSREGGFFSAEDADSEVPVAAVADRRTGGQQRAEVGARRAPLQKSEGAFYVWSKREIVSVLGDAAEIFNFHYGVEENGNVPAGSDPHREFTGKNILIERHSFAETAKHFRKSESEMGKKLQDARSTLLATRAQRPRPHRDDKIITAWNGLMISAYARAAQVFGDRSYLERATYAGEFIHTQLYNETRKTLARSFRGGRSEIEAFADDYAFVIQGLLDLYEASFETRWLKFAVELQKTQDALFADEPNGGYFSVSGKDPSILLRMKEDNDSAEPAASSVAALNLLRLAQFRDDTAARERAEKTISAFAPQISRFASAMPQMLVALDYSLAKPRQIIIAGKANADDTRAMLREVHRNFLPHKILILAGDGADRAYLDEKLEAVRAMTQVDGKATAYVCENFACQTPVTEPAALARLLLHAGL